MYLSYAEREQIQFMHNVHFVFTGSKQHMMCEMFGSPQHPFYQSTSMMSLTPLHEESVAQPQSNESVRKYGLSGASSVRKALKKLTDIDIV